MTAKCSHVCHGVCRRSTIAVVSEQDGAVGLRAAARREGDLLGTIEEGVDGKRAQGLGDDVAKLGLDRAIVNLGLLLQSIEHVVFEVIVTLFMPSLRWKQVAS